MLPDDGSGSYNFLSARPHEIDFQRDYRGPAVRRWGRLSPNNRGVPWNSQTNWSMWWTTTAGCETHSLRYCAQTEEMSRHSAPVESFWTDRVETSFHV